MIARVIVASNRAAAGVYRDESGRILAEGLRSMGFSVAEPTVVPDGDPVGRALRAAVSEAVDVVLTSGGTGLTSTDLTPEVTTAVVERPAPGIAEAVRAYGARVTSLAALSRGVAGVAGRTLIVNLAGSKGAARDGIEALRPILPHAVSQLADGDHMEKDET